MSEHPSNPEELLRRWQTDGDTDALDQLLRDEVQMLAARLRNRGHGMFRPSVSASDLAQEAVFRMLRLDEPPHFEDPRELRSYLWTAAWRLLLNRVQLKSRQVVSLSAAESRDLGDALFAQRDQQSIEQREQALALNVVMNLLKPEDREVLELVYFQHMEIEAVATKLGANRAAVDMRLSRARRRLAEKMLRWTDVIG
ncbi:MAG: sigma-70 family RNA polymerase sigma factor [Planctomycetota bacterium]